MNEGDITSRIVKEIKEKHIKPLPKAILWLKNGAWWLAICLLTVLGGLAVAAGIFLLNDYDWDVFTYLGRSPVEQAIMALPYLWIFLLVVSAAAVIYFAKKTKSGYRMCCAHWLLISLGVSLVSGVLFYSFGFGAWVHSRLAESSTFYRQMSNYKGEYWNNPSQGRLAGVVVVADNPNRFELEDSAGRHWLILTEEVDEDNLVNAKAIKPGDHVIVAGKVEAPWIFEAEVIHCWKP